MKKLTACFILLFALGATCFGQKVDYKQKVDSTLQKILEDYRTKENYIFLKYGEKELNDTLIWMYEKEIQPSPKVFQTIICKEKKEGQVGKIEIIFGFKNSEMNVNESIYAYLRTEMNSKNWLIYKYEKGKLQQSRETYENGVLKEITQLEMSLETFSSVLGRIASSFRVSDK